MMHNLLLLKQQITDTDKDLELDILNVFGPASGFNI